MSREADKIARLAADVERLSAEVQRLRAHVDALHEGARVLGVDVALAQQQSEQVVQRELELRYARSVAGRTRETGASRRRLVFVVDPDEQVQRLAAASLGSAGFDVRTFAAVETVIDHVAVEVPRAALIDLSLAGTPAVVLAEYLRRTARTSHVRRLGMTAFVPPARAVRAFSALIEKPLRPDELIDVVERSLRPRSRPA